MVWPAAMDTRQVSGRMTPRMVANRLLICCRLDRDDHDVALDTNSAGPALGRARSSHGQFLQALVVDVRAAAGHCPWRPALEDGRAHVAQADEPMEAMMFYPTISSWLKK